MTSLFSEPVFTTAVSDLAALGFRVTATPEPNGLPYGIVGGRSNKRWWLIPLDNRKTTVSGLALFQPIINSAKLLKRIAIVVSTLGLSSFWAKRKIYISGGEALAEVFGDGRLSYAFFTGTDSPHRKAAVQVMDGAGNIKGFAKVTRNPAVSSLLRHEAKTLRYLATLDLKTALIPKVLFSGEMNGAEVLVTDTLKTALSKTITELRSAHVRFVSELAAKTAFPADESKPVGVLLEKYSEIAEKLSPEWRNRLTSAIAQLALVSSGNLGPLSLSHGDFTSWNTFFVNERLYVFDWEYADSHQPLAGDVIQFLLSQPNAQKLAPKDTIERVNRTLFAYGLVKDVGQTTSLCLHYLCHRALHYAARVPAQPCLINQWDGSQEAAELLDSLMSGNH